MGIEPIRIGTPWKTIRIVRRLGPFAQLRQTKKVGASFSPLHNVWTGREHRTVWRFVRRKKREDLAKDVDENQLLIATAMLASSILVAAFIITGWRPIGMVGMMVAGLAAGMNFMWLRLRQK